MYTVYKVTGDIGEEVYYGYTDSKQTPEKNFLKRTGSKDLSRGDVRMLMKNNDDPEMLNYTIIDSCTDEMEAFISRNDHRAADGASIVGPSIFPGTIYDRVAKLSPKSLLNWKGRKYEECELPDFKLTGMEAYKLGRWDISEMKPLGVKFGNNVVRDDLNNLNSDEFALKYFGDVGYNRGKRK